MPIKVHDKGADKYRAPFPKPQTNEEIGYRRSWELPEYNPILVKVLRWDEATDKLTFQGVTLENTEDLSKVHEVDLNNAAHVWRFEPSTPLAGLGGENDHVLLCLTKAYTDLAPDISAHAMGDPVKWPRSAGEAEREAAQKVAALRQKIEHLENKLEMQRNYLAELAPLLGEDDKRKGRELFGDIF